jgi:hypothetical protein
MIPHLVRSDRVASAGVAPSLSPPPRFNPIVGPVSEVRLIVSDYRTATGTTWAQKNGLRYEGKVQERVRAEFPGYLCGPCIYFMDGWKQRMVQPDGILVFDAYVFIIEIKYQHMPEAWWQLQRLYYPLVCRLWPKKEVSCLEICRSYDPALGFPCEVTLVDDFKMWVSGPRQEFGVMVWK